MSCAPFILSCHSSEKPDRLEEISHLKALSRRQSYQRRLLDIHLGDMKESSGLLSCCSDACTWPSSVPLRFNSVLPGPLTAKGSTAYGYDSLGNLTTIQYPVSSNIS